jgi:hypothetical protein
VHLLRAVGMTLVRAEGHISTRTSTDKHAYKHDRDRKTTEPYFTTPSLLRDEDLLDDIGSFLRVSAGTFIPGDDGTLMLWGPKNPLHPQGIYSLGDYHHGKKTQRWNRPLSKWERYLWAARLFVELEYLERAPIASIYEDYLYQRRLYEGPPHAPVVLESFLLLVGVHWLTYPGQPVMFTRSFAAEWCGVSMKQAYDSLRWLEAEGFIRSGKRVRAKFWLPEALPQRVQLWSYG